MLINCSLPSLLPSQVDPEGVAQQVPSFPPMLSIGSLRQWGHALFQQRFRAEDANVSKDVFIQQLTWLILLGSGAFIAHRILDWME